MNAECTACRRHVNAPVKRFAELVALRCRSCGGPLRRRKSELCAECGRRTCNFRRPMFAWRAQSRGGYNRRPQLSLLVHDAGTACCDRHEPIGLGVRA